MNFFCTKKHYDDWTEQKRLNSSDIFCLDVREAMQVAEMLFANHPMEMELPEVIDRGGVGIGNMCEQ